MINAAIYGQTYPISSLCVATFGWFGSSGSMQFVNPYSIYSAEMFSVPSVTRKNTEFIRDDTEEPEGDILLRMDVVDGADLVLADGGRDLKRDPTFETAVILSLFQNRRAGLEDILPDNTDDRRGWFGDVLNEGQELEGSRLWLLSRSKTEQGVLPRAEEYASEALQWMLDGSIAQSITCVTERISMYELHLHINITRLKGMTELYKYYYNWKEQIYRRIV
jgi:phage gp46-like protein